MKVYVFKTSVRHQDVSKVSQIISVLVPGAHWNFDLDDCDNILKIESNRSVSEEIRNGLIKFGFLCQELQ